MPTTKVGDVSLNDVDNRFAAVDIGTNSVRLLIARLTNRQLQTEFRTLRMCRPGEGMTRGEGLQPQAVARTLQALQEFSDLLQDYTGSPGQGGSHQRRQGSAECGVFC